jgi:hypothetical protein
MSYIVAFDLELNVLVPENVDWGGNDAPKITCAALYSAKFGTKLIFSEDCSEFSPHLDTNGYNCLLDSLWAHYEQGAIIVTWGGCAVDFRALYAGLTDDLSKEKCKILTRGHVDMTIAAVTETGMMMGLDAASRGMNQGNKCNALSKDSPRLWSAGKCFQVLEHVRNDAILTEKVYVAAFSLPTPALTWVTKRGKPRTWYICNRDLRVEECMKRKPPIMPFFPPKCMNRELSSDWALGGVQAIEDKNAEQIKKWSA